MTDLQVGADALATFAGTIATHSAPVGAECTATSGVLGSGVVQDALGNVSLVLTVLDRALAGGAGALGRDARSTGESWSSTDAGLVMRPV